MKCARPDKKKLITVVEGFEIFGDVTEEFKQTARAVRVPDLLEPVYTKRPFLLQFWWELTIMLLSQVQVGLLFVRTISSLPKGFRT